MEGAEKVSRNGIGTVLWNLTVFTNNRYRLLEAEVTWAFFEEVVAQVGDVAADKAYDTSDFVERLRRTT